MSEPALLGTELASKYAHLATAANGHDAVSNVVLSAAEQRPIVAVAVPFETAAGRRVISGGYSLEKTPLEAFLTATSAIPGREIYLVDGPGQVIASTQPADVRTVPPVRPGSFTVIRPIEGTSWRLVAEVPLDGLLAPLGTGWGTCAFVAATAILAIAVLGLLRSVYRQRDDLDRLSRTDALTGLANRSATEQLLSRAAAVSERTQRPWAVAMIDLDHFKSINDRLGHGAGDRVLRYAASVLAGEARAADAIGRWGGEEFLLVMGDTDATAARAAGERIVAAIRACSPPEAGLHLTVSVGTASATGGSVHGLVEEADRALYRAKGSGRDRVIAA